MKKVVATLLVLVLSCSFVVVNAEEYTARTPITLPPQFTSVSSIMESEDTRATAVAYCLVEFLESSDFSYVPDFGSDYYIIADKLSIIAIIPIDDDSTDIKSVAMMYMPYSGEFASPHLEVKVSASDLCWIASEKETKDYYIVPSMDVSWRWMAIADERW